MKIIRLLTKYSLELIMAVGGVWAVVGKIGLNVTGLGFAIFLGGVITAIYRLRSNTEHDAERVDELVKAVTKMETSVNALRIDRDLAYIQIALRDLDQKTSPHLYAGHQIALHAYQEVHELVGGLKRVKENEVSTATISENYVINSWLSKLAELLPNGSVWMGITQLTIGWLGNQADPGFVDFVATMERRSKLGELTVFRLYCVPDQIALGEIRDHLNREKDAGVQIRVRVGINPPDDISLLWSSPRDPIEVQKIKNPTRTARDRAAEALCAMKFVTRNSRAVSGVQVHTGESNSFKDISVDFDQAWNAASETW